MNKIKMRAHKGATFIEYALLAGLVAIVVAAAAMFFGDEIKGLFGDTGRQVGTVREGVQGAKLQVDTSVDKGDAGK